MNASWKTTLCGLLGALCIGLSQIPELPALWCKIAALLGGLLPSLGLLFARDNNVSSEQAGAVSKTAITGVAAKLPLLIALLCAPALLLVGCRDLAADGPYKGDKLAYEADTAIVSAYDTLHTFVKWERDNRTALAPYPEIRKAADTVRAGARQWITTAIAAREAYTVSPTPETRDALTRAVAVLRAALVESVKYLNQHPTP